MPHHKATVGGGDEQSVVDIRHAARDGFREDDAHDEAKSPVEPTGNRRGYCHQRDSTHGGTRDVRQRVDAAFYGWGGRQRRATYEHQCHLHGKCQEVPHPTAPVFDHFDGGLVTDRHGQDGRHEGE